MPSIPSLAETLRHVLSTAAETAGRQSRFIRRQRTLSGASFVQTLVFGWLANPDASLYELCQVAACQGLRLSPQALEQRFTPAAATCLEQTLAAAVQQAVAAEPVAVPLLARFAGVYLLDCSTITLPDALATVWPGCGNRAGHGAQAALKLAVCLELRHGQLQGPLLQPGRAHDRTTPLQTAPLPVGALRLADLGFFTLDHLAQLSAAGSLWLTRLQANTIICDATGRRLDLARWLRQQGAAVDQPVLLGARHQLAVRVLAQSVPPAVAAQRRRRLRAEARRRGETVRASRLALAAWTLFVTNVPQDQLALHEALVLARARWQIELLFKLWKQHGHLATSRSRKPWRLLCELYAKLLGLLLQHWLLVTALWAAPDRSLVQGAQTVRHHALALASTLHDPRALYHALTTLIRTLALGCRLNHRRAKPSTAQLLLDPALGA